MKYLYWREQVSHLLTWLYSTINFVQPQCGTRAIAMAAKHPKLDLVEFAARQNQILEQLNQCIKGTGCA